MPTVLDIQDFIERAATRPVVDVRTPAEYDRGHIPGAINVPLFSNEERIHIGTAYKQQDRESAILLGLDRVGPKMRTLIERVRKSCEGRELLVHCWRGGMRSESIAWLLSFAGGYTVYTLHGGYKTFRRWALSRFNTNRPLQILGGKTGSGKTDVLHYLKHQGEQVIDLEAMACHKGSAFGSLGQDRQPSQEQFENNLAWAWAHLDPTRSVWLEDESRRIGKCALPDALWTAMGEAPLFFLDVPTDLRIHSLVASYGIFAQDDLARGIMRIHKKLGGLRTRTALEALEMQDLETVCASLLAYYDKAYLHCLRHRSADRVYILPTATLDPEKNARLVQSFITYQTLPS